MATVSLTNGIANGSFETNINGWNGFQTNNQGVQSALTPTRIAVTAPVHGEYGSWCMQAGVKTQGKVYVQPTLPLSVVQTHKYYIKARVRLRGSTAGVASVCTVYDGQTVPAVGAVVPTPLTSGLQTTDTAGWVLIDDIWTADRASLNLRFLWQTTANQGNNDIYGLVDNVVMVDLTAEFGAGKEPPLFAIRQAVQDAGGYWDSAASVNIPPPPVITTQTIPEGLYKRNYSQQINLQQGEGTPPFSFTLLGLPSGHGLTISSSGLISGTLNLTDGLYDLIVQVTDSIGYVVAEHYDLDVHEPPVIHDTYIAGAILNQPYSFTPTFSGSDGNMVVTVQVTSGSLPTGLSISGKTISGTPTVDGQTCEITITATNDYDTATAVFTLGVFSKPKINTAATLLNGVVGVAYNLQLSASGVTPITWQLWSGSLPTGISFNVVTGTISGTPTATGQFTFEIRASNSLGNDVQSFVLNVYELPHITTVGFGYARLGTPYSGQLTATGTPPIKYSIVSGNLPTGLTLDGNTGIISGTPTATGQFLFSVVAENIAGDSAAEQFVINAGLALAIITTSPLPVGIVNTVYGGVAFAAAGIDGSYATTWGWAAQAGSTLPPGLSLNATTGILSGTPTTAGTYNVNVTVTNGTTNATSPFTLVVGIPPAITTGGSLDCIADEPFSVSFSATGTTPIAWSLAGGSTLPQGLNLSSGGVLSGTPTVVGITQFTVVATNAFGTHSKLIAFTVAAPPDDVEHTTWAEGSEVGHLFVDGSEVQCGYSGGVLVYERKKPKDILLVDAPLNGNLTDYSGNGNHLTPASAVAYATNDGRQVLAPAQYSYADLTAVNQSTYFNNFQIELDFYVIAFNTYTDACIIDGIKSGTAVPGIAIAYSNTQSVGFFNHTKASGGEIYLKFSNSLFSLNKWYKIKWTVANNIMTGIITDIATGNVIYNNNISVLTITTTPLTQILRIGNTQYAQNRAFNGYLRNFKLWKLN